MMMRTLKATLPILALLPVTARANDLSVGTVQLSGSGYFLFSHSTRTAEGAPTNDVTGVSGALAGLYYVTPHLGIGAALGGGTTHIESGTSTQDTSSFDFGPRLGIDYPVGRRVSIEAGAGLDYGRSFSKAEGPLLSGTSWYWDLGAKAGVKYYVVPVVSVDAALTYDYQWTHAGVAGDGSNLEVVAGFSVYFGRANAQRT